MAKLRIFHNKDMVTLTMTTPEFKQLADLLFMVSLLGCYDVSNIEDVFAQALRDFDDKEDGKTRKQ